MTTQRILLVDDEAGLCKVLGITLRDSGYDVITADDGHKALDLFEQFGPPIVITDIKMPGMDGIDLLKQIKNLNPDTEVIMITGHGDVDLAIKSLKHDATDFITKPINNDVLDVALERALERISMRAQLKDYTEHLEQLVEEKSRRLIAAERMAAVGQTVAGLSHAIKNIAGGLKGGAFVLEQGIELENSTYLLQGWDMIRGNVEKITNLSLDLLNYTKVSDTRFSRGDPNQPAREVCELMQAAAKEHAVALELDTAADPKPFRFDPEGLHRCLLNLVTNASTLVPMTSAPKAIRKLRSIPAAVRTEVLSTRWRTIVAVWMNRCSQNCFKSFSAPRAPRAPASV